MRTTAKPFSIPQNKNLLSLKEKKMRAYRFLTITILLISALLAFMAGCKYNVTAPLWDQPYKAPASPQITSINPASEAKAGVSTITIYGHNLVVTVPDSLVSDSTVVYFGSVQASIAAMESTAITVLRPNLATDSCTIRIVPHNAIAEAISGTYKIDPVIAQYGGFLQNLQLGAIAVDNSDYVYVIESSSLLIHKVTSNVDNTVIGGGAAVTAQTPYGAAIGPDGNLYVTEFNRSIDKVDLSAGTVAPWTKMPSGKIVKFCDFGPGGYFFAGGPKTDLCIVPPNPPATLTTAQIQLAGSYATEEILALKVFNGYVYVASRPANTTTPAIIWSNQIIGDSSVAPRQKVLDMSTTAFDSVLVTGLAFSSDGAMYIGTASVDPVLSVDPVSGKVSSFYKGIIPPYCAAMAWSKTSTYLYIISGNKSPAQTWTVYRLDMGSLGGSNF